MNTNIDPQVLSKAQTWMSSDFDPMTRDKVKDMIDNNPVELIDSFYRDLEFGTGGLRGIMGVGSNRMNKYTVGMATQGLANYLKICFPNEKIKIAIAFDCRNNSHYFAEVAASVLSANDLQVYLFDELRPTPELSFAIRHFGCHSGIVITASHNPKEYNGYKVYWNDGAQLVPPHDVNVINEVQKITSPTSVKFDKKLENIEVVGNEFDEIYLSKIKELSLSPDAIKRQKDLKIVYTPIHGTGRKLVPECLKLFGFENVIPVLEQMNVDGNFTTVKSPNPEEAEALNLAILKAKEIDAELVMATDPDADRVGIAIRNNDNKFILLNGNQTGSLLLYYLLNGWKNNNKIQGKEYIVKTIVTTRLMDDMAKHFGVKCYNVLTGFKYIAEIIGQNEKTMKFIGGGEESYGYLAGEFVRDKDAVMSCALIAEMAAWAKDNGKTLYQLLQEVYLKFGLYKEALHSITKKGKSGLEEIQQMMSDFRSNPPKQIAGIPVEIIADYKLKSELNLKNNTTSTIDLPKSDVLQFFLEDESIITVRPSGTEPKIKFYFGVRSDLNKIEDFDHKNEILDNKIKEIISSLNL